MTVGHSIGGMTPVLDPQQSQQRPDRLNNNTLFYQSTVYLEVLRCTDLPAAITARKNPIIAAILRM